MPTNTRVRCLPIRASTFLLACLSFSVMTTANAEISEVNEIIENSPNLIGPDDWNNIRLQIDEVRAGRSKKVRDINDDAKSQGTRNIGATEQTNYFKAFNADASDQFGYSIDISGNTLVVGAPNEQSNGSGADGSPSSNNLEDAGAAYVFGRGDNGWELEAYLKASNPGASDQFGFDVAIHNGLIVVGARYEDSSTTGVNSVPNDLVRNAGAAYIYSNESGTWQQEAYLKAHNTGRDDYFGYSVDIYNNTVVVGAWSEDSSTSGINPSTNNSLVDPGAVYVFVRDDSGWSQQAFIKASNTDNYDHFGDSVAIHENTIVVGTRYEDSSSPIINGSQGNDANRTDRDYGAAYVFRRVGVSWAQEAYLKAPNAGYRDYFGYSVDIHGDFIIVGATEEDSAGTGVNSDIYNNSATNSGAAYLFRRSLGGTWQYYEYLKASNTGNSDAFGYSVNISENLILVGALYEDGGADTVNGANNNNVTSAGAAYLYFIGQGSLSFLSYLKPNNTDDNDVFGYSVALSGASVIVSAPNEDSISQTINGDGSNNNAPLSGAVYSFGQTNSLHPVGGNVIGLAEGNSVHLVNNGTDFIEVAENGYFKFDPLYFDSAIYQVTVAENGQPVNPRQDCMIINGDGIISSMAVDTILVDCTLRNLSIPTNINTVESAIVSIPIQLAPEGLSLGGVAFSIDYDENCLNPDRDGNGGLDSVTVNVPTDFTTTVLFDPMDTDGEIDISIADFTPPISSLSTADIISIDFFVECPATQGVELYQTPVVFSQDPPPSFADLIAQDVEGTLANGMIRVWDGIAGDCNVGNGVTVADLIALGQELDDDDGTNYIDAPESTFFGSPQGCDANGSTEITVADYTCANLILFGNQCGPVRSPNATALPEVNVSTRFEDDIVWLQTRLFHNGHSISGFRYQLVFDEDFYDMSYIDINEDELPDRIVFPQGVVDTSIIRWDEESKVLGVILIDTVENLLDEGLLMEIGVPMSHLPDSGLSYISDPVPSFSDSGGTDVIGTVSIGDVIFDDHFED